MKRQLRERLRQETNVPLAQSTIYIQQKSIIHQLGDLINQQDQANDHKPFQNIGSPSRIGLATANSTNNFSAFKNLRQRNQFLKTQYKPKDMYNQRSSNKFDYIKSGQTATNDGLSARIMGKNHLLAYEERQRRNSFKDPVIYQSKKQPQNNLRTKFDFNRSGIVKQKQFIYHNLLSRCENCQSIKSQIFRNNFMCSNLKCRMMKVFENIQTFSLCGLLYQIQVPSSTEEQLGQLIKKIAMQIQKLENWRNSLVELQFQIQNIVESRKEFQKQNKNQLRDLLTTIGNYKFKKSREFSKEDIQICIRKLQKIQLRPVYEQFHRWKKINCEKISNSKGITDLIQKYKPLCLKTVSSDIVSQVSQISDNFANSQIIVNSNQFLSFNFNGHLNKLNLVIDGSIQLKRDNFLLVEKLQQLKLNFQNRKTSRQLRQLFNILPSSVSLCLTFDFKMHSHVSGQNFPIITKACELAEKSLSIQLLNARSQVFEDLIQASKAIKQKSKLKMRIQMNPFITENEWPQFAKSQDWGTKMLKLLLKNIGTKVTNINLSLPFYFNIEQIYEYLINADYSMLCQMQICKKDKIRQLKQNIVDLLSRIVNRRMALLCLLANQKRQSSHVLNKNYRVAQSVYKVLF